MARVDFEVLLGVALGASIDHSFLCCSEVHRGFALEELEGKTACEPKVHVLGGVFLVGLWDSS